MQRAAVGLWCVLLLPLGACERVAGLDGKNFSGPTGGNTSSGGAISQGGQGMAGTSPAGRDSGGTTSGGGNGDAADGPGGNGSGGFTDSNGGRNGGRGAEGGDGGTGGVPRACENVTEKLCMRPTWPDGVVPYVVDDNLPTFLAGIVEEAIAPWEGMRIGSTALHFVTGSIPNVPTLVFSLERGCGPVRVTDEAVTLAFDSCKPASPDRRPNVARAVGVALGLPRMHQRADRDRYLQMASASEFDCTRSEIYEKCPDLGDIPAALGPFDFKTLMFAPGVDWLLCVPGVREFPFLYVPRAAPEPSIQCELVGMDSTEVYREQDALAELYAIRHGWRPATVMGVEGPSLEPLNVELAPGIEQSGSFSVVALEESRMALFSVDHTSSPSADPLPQHIWMDGDRLSLPAVPALYGDFVARRRSRDSNVVDFLYVTRDRFYLIERTKELFHASYNVVTGEGSDWTALTPPFGPDPPYPMAFTASTGGNVLIYAQDARPLSSNASESDVLGFGTYVLEWDFTTAPEWRSLPRLNSPEPLQALSVHVAAGEHHLVGSTLGELLYASRTANGDWSAWSTLAQLEAAPQAIDVREASFVSTQSHEIALMGSGPGHFWFWACNERPCNDPSAWSEPIVVRMPERYSEQKGSIEAIVSTDYHELGMIVHFASYNWFFACGTGPCDNPSAWSEPIVSGPGSRGSAAAFGWSDRIDLFTFNTEDRPPWQWRLGGVWHKRWIAPSP